MARLRQEPSSAQVNTRKVRPLRATGPQDHARPDDNDDTDADTDATGNGDADSSAGPPAAGDVERRIRAHLDNITTALNNHNKQHALNLYHGAFQEFVIEGTIDSAVERYIDLATLRWLEVEAEESIQASTETKSRTHARALARPPWRLSALKIWCLFSHDNKWPCSAFLGGLRDLSVGEPDLTAAVKLMQEATKEREKARVFKALEQKRMQPRGKWIPFTRLDAHLAIELWGEQTGRSTLELSNFSKDPSRKPRGDAKNKRRARREDSVLSQPENQSDDGEDGGQGIEGEEQQQNGSVDGGQGDDNGGETQPQDDSNEPEREDVNEDELQQHNDSHEPRQEDNDEEEDVPTPEQGRGDGGEGGLEDMSTEMSYADDTRLTFGDEHPDSSPLDARRRSEARPSTSASAQARLRLMQEAPRRPQKLRRSSSFSTESWYHFRRPETDRTHRRVTRARSAESSFRLGCGGNSYESTPASTRLQRPNTQHDEAIAANAIVQMATSLDPASTASRKIKRPRLTYDRRTMRLQPWLDVLASNDTIAAPAAVLQHANVDSAILNHNGPGTAIIVLHTVPATSDNVKELAFADISPSRITLHLPRLDGEINDHFTATVTQLRTHLPRPPAGEADAQQGQVRDQPVNSVALPFSAGGIPDIARVLVAVAYHLSPHMTAMPESLDDFNLWTYAAAVCMQNDPSTTAPMRFLRPYLDGTPPTPMSSHTPANSDMTFSCSTLRTLSAEWTQRLQQLEQAAVEVSRIRDVFRRPQDRTATARNQTGATTSEGRIDHTREKIRLAEEDLANGDPHSPTRSLDVTRLDGLKAMLQQQLATQEEQTARIERRQVIVKQLAVDMADYGDEAKILRSDLAQWRQQWLDFASSL
ncbi:hypothetical protein AC578_1463 [Pseudocercospora eumusae]|uniref:Uncharacterized protein n=1 Tax=Pseudocercospora eumusae TaxID=321146 RepID=A0A139H6N1_9PEZI|nr:hypothetical protein AC578_1463 [Pseudocercospora eumusae]